MKRPPTHPFIADSVRASWVPPFRGEIYEYAASLDLQAGYAVKGKFDVATMRHIKEPLEAIRDPNVRLVSILGAVQTVKTLIAETVIPYWIEHDPGDILFLYEDDPKARQMSDERLMPLLRSIPGIARMLEDVDRHSQTKTKIKFSHCTLTVAGLNVGNVQSVSYRYVIADEAWMARANGLLRQAIYRTTQYPDTKKIIILGQGGWADEDAHEIHRETDMRELQWACPACGAYQPFELSKMRDDTFPNEALRQTYAGLSWDTTDTTKPEGKWDYEAVGKTAHIRCYHCDHRVEDTPEIRRALMDSYKFVATNPHAPRDSVGFHWPAPASVRIPLSKLVVRYLKAKVAKDELSYTLPLQEFYQKDWAIHWQDDLAQEYRNITPEAYDFKSPWEEEKYRTLIVDCQRDLQKFFYSVFAVSLKGESRMLARGMAESFDELAAIQKEHSVKDQHTFLDCGYEMTKVLRECVRHGHYGEIKVGNSFRKIWLCWTGLKGSGAEMFVHENPRTKAKEFRIYSQCKMWNTNIGTGKHGFRAPWYEWSNLHCKDLLRARRDADEGIPKFLVLPDTLPQEDPWSYFAQMRSERRRETFAGGKKRSVWELVKESRQNHDWDIGAMLMAFMCIVGVIGVDLGEAEE